MVASNECRPFLRHEIMHADEHNPGVNAANVATFLPTHLAGICGVPGWNSADVCTAELQGASDSQLSRNRDHLMCVAAIYDIHGNLPALEAVLDEVRQADVDQIVVGGDVVPGPMPCETTAALLGLEVPVHFIRGNGESEVLAVRAGAKPSAAVPEEFHDVIRWVAHELLAEQARVLGEWPLTLRLEVPGVGEVMFCHATPRSDAEIFTRLTPEDHLLPIFEPTGAALVICGHTHMQFDRAIGGVRVVNAGSVGMPFGEPGADWLLLGPDVEFKHTPYDLTAAAERIRATDYPQASSFAEGHVLRPPAEAEMLALFERSAVH